MRRDAIKINLNNQIYVKLTKVGEEIYHDYIKEINDYYGREIIDKYIPNYEDGGFARFQLWEFMNIYGNYIGMGFPNVIEPLDIYVEQ
jgi:hypothetical protein